MNKKELVKSVAEATEITQKDAERVITATFDAITAAMVAGDEVSVPNFGKFCVASVEERTARNPQDGSEVVVPAHNKPKFKASSVLRMNLK